jgi:hypothetical protein
MSNGRYAPKRAKEGGNEKSECEEREMKLMTSAAMQARIVRIKVEKGKEGLFYATSPSLKGLLVAEPTLEALDEAIPSAVADLYLACGVKVIVTRIEHEDDDFTPWIAIPTEIAKRAMARLEA